MNLMMNEPLFHIEATDEFTHNLKRLNKKYRNVRVDVGAFIEQLAAGNFQGDRVQGTKSVVFKARIKSSDLSRGKSGGYRIIYYLRTSNAILLITVYAKSEQSDVSLNKIRRIIDDYEASHN